MKRIIYLGFTLIFGSACVEHHSAPPLTVQVQEPKPIATEEVKATPTPSPESIPELDPAEDKAKTNETLQNSAEAMVATEKPETKSTASLKAVGPGDQTRIEEYKSFIEGSLSTDDFVKLLFKDSDFNRGVQVVGELYKEDKAQGRITPETEVKFEELGQKVGNAVLIHNRRKQQEHFSNLAESVIVGTLIGGVAGGFLMKEEWIPKVVRTKLGDRLPGYIRDPLLGGLAGGTTVLITMETFHIINNLARPNAVYNADPLLDNPSSGMVRNKQ